MINKKCFPRRFEVYNIQHILQFYAKTAYSLSKQFLYILIQNKTNTIRFMDNGKRQRESYFADDRT